MERAILVAAPTRNVTQEEADEHLGELARLTETAGGEVAGLLRQRELLLAQSSDWAFIMTTGTMTAYAERRTREHAARFTRLYEMIRGGNIDEGWLADVESKDTIFQEVDYRVYR